MAAASRPGPKPQWNAPSHLEVFVRNLKLLHLDQREDWPGVTLRSLSPSPQNQRQRIRVVEWALYYLFTIWDPEVAQNVLTVQCPRRIEQPANFVQKLRPFFPPLEALTSVNLRAALFRCLTEWKKSDDHGRQTILRKTMLDDCKGEKFEELLAVFSTAVLRKLVAVSAGDMLWNPAMRLSTAASITPTDYQDLVPLILAHQVSLNAAGVRRARVHETYDQFSRLLDNKRIELAERANEERSGVVDAQADSDGLARVIRTNWLGSEEWATALLEGGSQSSTDAFLELPFSQAWARATASAVDDIGSDVKPDLVVDLEARVLRLRSRARRWHEFNERLRKERDDGSSATEKDTPESRLLFRDHQALTVASISKAVRQPENRERMLNEVDRSFMSTVNEAVSHINGKAQPNSESPPAAGAEVARPLSHRTQAPEDEPSGQPESPDTSPASQNDTTQPTPPIVRLSPDQHSEDEKEPDPEPTKSSTSSYTLVERTRKSMSLIPPQQTQGTQSHPLKRRGPRPSFPTNQFETPRKSSTQSRPSAGRSGASTPQDKLFEEDADYASVFKSRPRIALSPVSSPAVHFSPSLDEGEFELDLDAEYGDVDSPLAASRVRG